MTALFNRRTALSLTAAAALMSRTTFAATPERTGETPMSNSLEEVCAKYLNAWQKKDINAIAACAHPDIRFISPTATFSGRDKYLASAQQFFAIFDRLDRHKEFYADDAAMFALNFHCIAPIGDCPTAELVAIKDGLICTDQLFFDAQPFAAMAHAKAAAAGGK